MSGISRGRREKNGQEKGIGRNNGQKLTKFDEKHLSTNLKKF